MQREQIAEIAQDELNGKLATGKSTMWLWDPNENRVWLNYRQRQGDQLALSLVDWLDSLDSGCRVAVTDTLYRLAHLKKEQICNLCHNDGTWYKFSLKPMELNGYAFIGAQVSLLRSQLSGVSSALHDSESGLMSSDLFRELLIQALRLSERNQEPFILLTIQFNNHLDGSDQTFAPLLADVLSQRLRSSDSIGRFGKGEVLVLLYGAKPQVAEKVAEKLYMDVENSLRQYPHHPVNIGWAFYPSQGADVDSLLAHRFDNKLI